MLAFTKKFLPPPPHKLSRVISRVGSSKGPNTWLGREQRCPGGQAGPGHLSRNVLLIAQAGSVGVLGAHTIHGMLCLGSCPAIHLERGGDSLKRVALDPGNAGRRVSRLPSPNASPKPLSSKVLQGSRVSQYPKSHLLRI